jgi:hypothetical protein
VRVIGHADCEILRDWAEAWGGGVRVLGNLIAQLGIGERGLGIAVPCSAGGAVCTIEPHPRKWAECSVGAGSIYLNDSHVSDPRSITAVFDGFWETPEPREGALLVALEDRGIRDQVDMQDVYSGLRFWSGV